MRRFSHYPRPACSSVVCYTINMEPFILRYGRRVSQSPSVEGSSYNLQLESLVQDGSQHRAIENLPFLSQVTGSLLTKADRDPTTDEPGDR